MKDFDKNIFNLQNCLGNNDRGWLGKRMVYEGGAPAEGPKPEAEKPLIGPELDVNNPDFDNHNFAQEKKGEFANNLDIAIQNTLQQVDVLKKNPEALLKLKNEFSAGLIEKIKQYAPAIAKSVEKKSPALVEQSKNPQQVDMTWFQNVLFNLNCFSVSLVYDTVKDVTKFKFYSKSGEIVFPQTDIAIQYVPQAVREGVTRGIETEEQPTEFTVPRNAKVNKFNKAIDHLDLIEKSNVGRQPAEGDRVVVKRGYSILKATFSEEKKQFITEANHPMWFIAGDKVTFYPKTSEKPKESLTANVDGQEYPIITQVDVPAGTNYLKIAEAILKYETGKGAVFNGKQILDDTQASLIVATGINKAEYAYLLQKVHESLPKGSRLPVIRPNKNTARARAQIEIEKQQEQINYEKEVKAAEAKKADLETSSALDVVRRSLESADQQKLDNLVKEYDQKLKAYASGSEGFNEVWEEFWDKMESFFKNAGLSREVKNSTYLAMKAGKDCTAWKDMWKENPTTERIMDVVKQYSDVFGNKLSKNAVRNKVWTLVYDIGEGETFDSEDILAVFGIKLPNELEYEDVLAMAAYQGPLAKPEMKSIGKKCHRYAAAVEGLGNAIRDMDPGRTTRQTSRRLSESTEYSDNIAKDLATLVKLLAVDSATPLQREKAGTYSTLIEKGGKRLVLRSADQGTGQYLSVHDPDTNNTLFREFDNGRLDADDYVDKINDLFNTQASTVRGEKVGESIPSLRLNNKPTYYSLRDMESLHEDVPGMPIKELMETGKKGATRFGFDIDNLNNTLTKGVITALRRMGVYENAKFVDSPENRKEIQGNDSALVNVRYRGRDLTMKFDNTTFDYDIYIAQGFNQSENKMARAHSEGGKLSELDDAIRNIDNLISKHASTAAHMETRSNVERIATTLQPWTQLNQQLFQYVQAVKYPGNLGLDMNQFMEVVFRTHSFAELKAENCIMKVEGQPNGFILVKLPAKLDHIGNNKALLDLVYSIKYGTNPDRHFVALTSSSAEKAREAVNEDAKYRSRLKKLFAYGLTDYDLEGRKATMQDVDVGRDSVSYSSKDEYFKKASGTAAYNDFLMNVRTFTPEGKEIIDANKANAQINDFYKKGLAKLDLLKRAPYYAELAKQVTDAQRSKTLDINQDISDVEMKIVRLGYLNYSEMKEAEQTKSVEKFKAKLIENILSLLPETVEGPNGEKVSKEQARATLKQFPVGILLSFSYDPQREAVRDSSNLQLGLHAPIILDVFNSKFAKLVLLPGVSNRGLDLVVGMSFTSKDPEWKDQRVIFYGGVSAGVTLGPNTAFNTAISGGIDFKVCKADDKDNFNYYMGVTGAVGVQFGRETILGGGPGLKLIQWELDAQQMYTNELNAKYSKEGVKGYLDSLTSIYKNGSKPEQIAQFCKTLKADKKMAKEMGLTGKESDAEVLMKFEQYIALLTENFNEEFDLPAVTGGELSFSVMHGVLIASGGATGNVPLVLGTVAAWAIQFLGSLNFNVGSRMVTSRETKTSEETMNTFNDLETQKQFDTAFSALPKSSAAAEFFTSGRTTLDAQGQKRTGMGGINSQSANIEFSNLDKTLANFNKELATRNIAIRVQKNPDNTIEIVLLDSQVGNNERVLISPNLVTVRNDGRIFLRDPNKLSSLYFNQQSRVYPLETSHGATIETITTISDNRYYKGDKFPTDVSITRFADNKDNPIFEGGKFDKPPVPYENLEIDRAGIKTEHEAMAKALDKSAGEKQENLREGLTKKIAKEIYKYRNKKGETFLSITNNEAKENLDNPNYLSEKLYAFYDEFSTSKKIEPFNDHEKRMLTLELSTLRYTELMAGRTSVFDRAKALKERLEWAEKTLTPYFQARIDELKKQGKEVTHTAAALAKKATTDLLYLDTKMPRTELAPGTSVAISVGRGGNGLHQIIDGSRDPKDVEQYGYILGRDYTEALRSATPGNEDYEIGLILMGQLSNMPERSNMKEFMDSNLARKLASNGGLRFILGSNNYREITNYYQNGVGNPENPGMKQFIDIVTQIRQTQLAGKDSLTITGEKNVKYLVRVITRVQSGIFNKCGNYSSVINEEISIIPPPAEEAMALFAASSEGRTTLNTKSYKVFAGVTGAVALNAAPPGGGGGGGTEPEAPAEGTVGQTPGGPATPPTTPGTPQTPPEAAPDINAGP